MTVTKAKYMNNELNKQDNIKATIDGAECFVPIDTSNTHYQAIQEWAKTNTIEEAD
jgi:hypothetical protein